MARENPFPKVEIIAQDWNGKLLNICPFGHTGGKE